MKFTVAGGLKSSRIAKWNGKTWSGIGRGIRGEYVGALTMMGSELFVGGKFTAAGKVRANHIAKWDGKAWSAPGRGMNNSVRALAVIDGDLFAGGMFTKAGAADSRHIATALGPKSKRKSRDEGDSFKLRTLAIDGKIGKDGYYAGYLSKGSPAARREVVLAPEKTPQFVILEFTKFEVDKNTFVFKVGKFPAPPKLDVSGKAPYLVAATDGRMWVEFRAKNDLRQALFVQSRPLHRGGTSGQTASFQSKHLRGQYLGNQKHSLKVAPPKSSSDKLNATWVLERKESKKR